MKADTHTYTMVYDQIQEMGVIEPTHILVLSLVISIMATTKQLEIHLTSKFVHDRYPGISVASADRAFAFLQSGENPILGYIKKKGNGKVATRHIIPLHSTLLKILKQDGSPLAQAKKDILNTARESKTMWADTNKAETRDETFVAMRTQHLRVKAWTWAFQVGFTRVVGQRFESWSGSRHFRTMVNRADHLKASLIEGSYNYRVLEAYFEEKLGTTDIPSPEDYVKQVKRLTTKVDSTERNLSMISNDPNSVLYEGETA